MPGLPPLQPSAPPPFPGAAPAFTGQPPALTPPTPPPAAPDVFEDKQLDKLVKRASEYVRTEEQRGNVYKEGFTAGEVKDQRLDSTQPSKGNPEDQVIANKTFAFISILLSLLYTQDPKIEVEPIAQAGGTDQYFAPLLQAGLIPDIDTARRQYADTVAKELEYSYRVTQSSAHIGATLFEALINNYGIIKIGWDDAKGCERIDALQRHEVYFDPNARFDVTQCKYVAHSVSMPLEDAQDFIQAKLDALLPMLAQRGQLGPDGQPLPGNDFRLKPGFKAADLAPNAKSTSTTAGGLDADRKTFDEDKGDQFTFFEVWKRGRTPAENWVYYRTLDSQIVNFRMPWPFMLPEGEFPFQQLAFVRVGRRLDDAFSEIRVVSGLKKVYDSITLYLRKFTLRAIAKKLLFDKSLDEETVAKLMSSGSNSEFEAIGIDLHGTDISKAVHVLDMNVGDQPAMEIMNLVDREISQVIGFDELQENGNAPQKMTAHEAEIRNNNAQNRRERRKGLFDEFQARVFRLRSCIARQRVDPAKIFRLAGELPAALWQLQAAEPDEYLEEYEVSILSGSTGINHRAEMLQNLETLRNMFIQTNQMAAQGGMPPPYDIQKITDDWAELQNKSADRYKIKEQPQQPPMPGMQTQQPAQSLPGQATPPVPPPAAGAGVPPPAAAGPSHRQQLPPSHAPMQAIVRRSA